MIKHFSISIPLIAITYIFCSSAYAIEPQEHFDYWKKLLHYDGKQSMVISNSFFLHENGNIDHIAELNATIELLNYENGNIIACNYPARYLWIKNSGYDVQSFDIESCPELYDYVSNFQKDSLYLVFASESLDSPASVFGHILLVFHDDDKPLLAADTIHYAAETHRDNIFKYVYWGLSGGYSGYYFRTPFYIIKYNHIIVKQRSLYFYRLDLSPEQIKYLIYHLFELRKATYRYYFIRENCAYQIARLLDIAYTDKNIELEYSLSVLPEEVVNHYFDRAVGQFTIEASVMRAQRIFELMASEETRIYYSVTRGELPIQESLPDKVKEVLAIKHEYMFRRFGRVLSDYDETVGLRFNNSLPEPPISDLTGNKNKNLLGFGVYSDSSSQGLYIQYRPIGRDIYENQFTKIQESHLTLLDTQIIVTDNETTRLQRFDIISVKSLFNKSKLSLAASWTLNLGINRQNSLNKATYDFSLGLGRGYSGKRIGVSLLIEAGFQDSDSEGNEYLKPSLDLIYYPTDYIKIGLGALMKYGNYGRYEESFVFLSKDFSKFSILVKHVMSNSISGDYSIAILRKHF